jgi:hypothetical protein
MGFPILRSSTSATAKYRLHPPFTRLSSAAHTTHTRAVQIHPDRFAQLTTICTISRGHSPQLSPDAMASYGKHARFLEDLLHTPEGVILPTGTDLTPYYHPFGFSIYRTAYDPSTEQHWQAILDGIHADVIEQMTGPDGTYQADPVAQQILSLFRLDARSDPDTLAGLDMEEVRNVYKNGNGGQPMNANDKVRRCFLLVDEEVIEEYQAVSRTPGYRPWVKCVEVDVASDHVPRNTRLGGQRYFGWMKMAIQSVPQLWSMLGLKWLSELAPATIGGANLVVWDDPGEF